MSSIRHSLDYSQFYSLTLDYNHKEQKLKVTVNNDGNPWPRFMDAVAEQLHLADKNTAANAREKQKPPARHGHSITFSNVTREFTLCMGAEPIGTYSIDPSGALKQTLHRQLTSDETRRIGTFHKCEPYSQRRLDMTWEENQALLAQAKQSVFTDIHTHSSGQISAIGLLTVAMKQHPYYYPISLLREAGINTVYDHIPKQKRKMIKRIPFKPKEIPGVEYPDEVEGADLHALSPDDINKLAAKMSLPADRQSSFTQVEFGCYRFRYPLSKDASLIKAIREKEAEEYSTQGIEFSLSSFVGIDDPHLLRTLHEVTAKAEAVSKKTGLTQRFMIGIPRGLSPEKMRDAIEKAKILMDSPYIMGIDILGYEANKTKEFVTILDDYARWANQHFPGSFIRVHAGENDKNHDNVKDFLKIAVKYSRLNYFVGHGVYGMDEETTRLAKRLCKPGHEQLTLEFNPSSNIALNNINDVSQVPFKNAIVNELPFIVSSDSAGLYHTDATQLGLAAFYAGLDKKGFDLLRKYQERLIGKMHVYSKFVESTIPHWNTAEEKSSWVEQIIARLASYNSKIPATPKEDKEAMAARLAAENAAINAKLKTDQVSLIEPGEKPAELEGKFPITLIGSSGESWKRLSKGQQRENAIAIDMLIHALGDKSYIVQGRNKGIGLSKVINQSLRDSNEHRRKTGHPELFNVGILMNPTFEEKDSYKHLSHMIRVPGQQLDLADAIVDHTFNHHGSLVAVGGAAYTADIILNADQRGIHEKHPENRKMMLLLANTSGASGEKAALLHPDYKAQDGRQLIKKLYKNRKDLFPVNFDKSENLNKLYHESAARVTTYGYNEVDSNVIAGPKVIMPTKTSAKPHTIV